LLSVGDKISELPRDTKAEETLLSGWIGDVNRETLGNEIRAELRVTYCLPPLSAITRCPTLKPSILSSNTNAYLTIPWTVRYVSAELEVQSSLGPPLPFSRPQRTTSVDPPLK
jgi:hypothetical protein